MGKITKGFNYIIGAIRALVTSVFAAIMLLVLFPTITAMASVLNYGVWMLFRAEFYLLVLTLTAIIGIAGLISRIVVPDIPTGE